jgi:hypothetical protein
MLWGKWFVTITVTTWRIIAHIQILPMWKLAMEAIILYLMAWYRQHSWIQVTCTILIAKTRLSMFLIAQIVWKFFNKIAHSFTLSDILQTGLTHWLNSIIIRLQIIFLILLQLEFPDLQHKEKFAQE